MEDGDRDFEAAPARDVGLGTLYERGAIYAHLDRRASPAPRTALEGPADGVAGMKGLHLLGLARRGTRVTVVHPDREAIARVRRVYLRAGLADRLEALATPEPPERTFDLVLSFNAGPLVPDWRAHLEGLARRARRLVVFATHRGSYGVAIRRAMRLLERAPRPALFDHPSTDPRELEPHLRRLGRIVRRDFVDCPWWPDLFVEAGETLAGAGLGPLGLGSAAPPRHVYGPDELPFGRGPRPPALAAAMRWHPRFDRAPASLAGCFAHHRVYHVRIHPRAG